MHIKKFNEANSVGVPSAQNSKNEITDKCYIIFSLTIGSIYPLTLKSEKIFGHKNIMMFGHIRDMTNRILNTVGYTINIVF